MKVKYVNFWVLIKTMKKVTNQMIVSSLEMIKTPIVHERKMYIFVDIYPSYLFHGTI
jgi:hypothetical protein